MTYKTALSFHSFKCVCVCVCVCVLYLNINIRYEHTLNRKLHRSFNSCTHENKKRMQNYKSDCMSALFYPSMKQEDCFVLLDVPVAEAPVISIVNASLRRQNVTTAAFKMELEKG